MKRLAALLLMGLCLQCAPPAGDLPHILFITLDTCRADHLSCYGYSSFEPTTPHLDRLADDGQRLTGMKAVSSWTLPTHASLFTGLYPSTHGAHSAEEGPLSLAQVVKEENPLYKRFKANGLADKALTLAEVLQDAGYHTVGVGAGPWLDETFGLNQGFDEYDCELKETWGRRANEVTDLAIAALEARGDQPLFLFLNYFDPHTPWDPPPPYDDRFPVDWLVRVPLEPQIARAYDISKYDGEISFMDQEIGRLLEDLKARGLYDDTLIVAVGDHGELLGEYDLWFHGFSLFEEEVQVPCIIKGHGRWTALPDTDLRCQQVDLMPTLLQGLGLACPGALEGQPLNSLRHPIVCELFKNPGHVAAYGPRFDRKLQAVYFEDYKLLHSSREADPDAGLFDLRRWPREEDDLTAEHPQLKDHLKERLKAWNASLRSPLKPRRIPVLDRELEDQLRSLGY